MTLVTGANRGIGLEVARALGDREFRVLATARTADKALKTEAWLERHVPESRARALICDLTSLDAVRELAGRILATTDRLDALVLNAATAPSRRTLTADGHEAQFQVNHLAGFLLQRLLDPLLRQTADRYGEARVVVVTSEAHRNAPLDLDDLDFERRVYLKIRAYGASKLANLLFAYALDRRLAGSGVTANAVHPGTVSTGLLGRMFGPLYPLRYLARSARSGAAPVVRVAESADLTGVGGRYFNRFDEVSSSSVSYDEGLQEALWGRSAELVGLSQAT